MKSDYTVVMKHRKILNAKSNSSYGNGPSLLGARAWPLSNCPDLVPGKKFVI
jgi:hypothetical protein